MTLRLSVTIPVDIAIKTLRKHSGVITHAAKELGIDRHSLSRYIKETPSLKKELQDQINLYFEKKKIRLNSVKC